MCNSASACSCPVICCMQESSDAMAVTPQDPDEADPDQNEPETVATEMNDIDTGTVYE